MEPEQIRSGRERARALFVERIASSGVIPYKKQTLAAHLETLRHVGDYAAHLAEESLVTLADEVLSAAARAKGVCPSEMVMRAMVDGKEPRPFEMAPIVTNWLASIEGPKAEAGAYEAQLFRHLRNHPRPVLPHDLTLVRQQADSDRRREAVVRERIENGGASEEERGWLAALVEDRRRARAIIQAGDAARREKKRAVEEGAA
ncbi:hypothetical protein [Pseudogemmobacter faecipullorum]|uniref:Uncharacterized protein n=1 Tax=Pseudogemmobacter faecipullorum TaxID=2755041 RepID=A0ABS8CTH7_9RHOB|nr:hypothetical protein [Pseudogemmobacter faecipullorum]MCB5412455.1 hypothetical protein [Pseudogemmobacter faecipullorum]